MTHSDNRYSIFTEEPLNKGHIGIRYTVPCREAVLITKVSLHQDKPDGIFIIIILCTEVVLTPEYL